MRRREAQPNPNAAERAGQLRADPGDVRRFARRREESERVGPMTTLMRYAVAALVVAGIGIAYWNWDTLRNIELDFSALTNSFNDGTPNNPVTSTLGGEPDTVVVEDSGVAGAAIESRIGGAPSEEELAASAAPAPAAAAPVAPPPGPSAETNARAPSGETTAAAPTPAAPVEAPVERPPVVVPVEPEPPPGPETFEFGLPSITVSEADASAAIIVLRYGDRRRVSSVTWSTRDGTAQAGTDYVDRGSVVERFAAGEQNRTLFVPIVGDRNAEGPETFFVRVVPPDGTAPMEIEVVINDDD